MTARDIKCIRCKQLWTSTVEEPFQDWEIINDDHGRVCVSERYYRPDYWHWIGLCPDCQIKPKEEVKPIPVNETRSYAQWLDNIDSRMIQLERSHKECLKTQEKRIAKLERESERVWEMIRRLGSIIGLIS